MLFYVDLDSSILILGTSNLGNQSRLAWKTMFLFKKKGKHFSFLP